MVTREQLRSLAVRARSQTRFADDTVDGECVRVCDTLGSILRGERIEHDFVEGTFDRPDQKATSHYWVEVPRWEVEGADVELIVDPTVDQFVRESPSDAGIAPSTFQTPVALFPVTADVYASYYEPISYKRSI